MGAIVVKTISFVAQFGALSLALVAVSPAIAQTVPVIPYNAGSALQSSEEAQRTAPQRPVGVPVLPRLVEPPSP